MSLTENALGHAMCNTCPAYEPIPKQNNIGRCLAEPATFRGASSSSGVHLAEWPVVMGYFSCMRHPRNQHLMSRSFESTEAALPLPVVHPIEQPEEEIGPSPLKSLLGSLRADMFDAMRSRDSAPDAIESAGEGATHADVAQAEVREVKFLNPMIQDWVERKLDEELTREA